MPIVGIIDTGADTSVLPDGYRGLLGYDGRHLEAAQIQQVQGTASVHQATLAATCEIVGVSGFSFDMRPMFVPGAQNALWGRLDFLAACLLEVDEGSQTFTLTLPDPAQPTPSPPAASPP